MKIWLPFLILLFLILYANDVTLEHVSRQISDGITSIIDQFRR